jgi:ABC-type polysaccharide/polyol phosphate export permease
MGDGPAAAPRTLVLSDRPEPWGAWLADLRRHREVLGALVRKDFQTRYKRAALGVIWVVAVPLLQGAVLALVFSKVVRTGGGDGFTEYVLAGILPWAYFSGTLAGATTSIVDGAGLTDKVWFPRVLLVVVPCLSNLIGFVVSILVLLGTLPFLHAPMGLHLLLLVPASVLLVAFTLGLSLVVSALHVSFRDVRFLVQAALLIWIYVTPILYRASLLGHLAPWIDANPLTGVVALFHTAVGGHEALARPVLVAVGASLVLVAVGLEAQRRRDRLFVDLL